jgi:hypothetical protein
MDQRWKKTEEEGLKNLLKHFDRLHDKLFTFNNILIAGYFALAKLENNISVFTILIPITNLIILLFVEYRMMQKCRFEAQITTRPMSEIQKWGKGVSITNLYSLLTMISTSMVTIMFLKYLLSN